jgi:hypothetical protein
VDAITDSLLLRKSGSAGNRSRDLWICSQELSPLDDRGGPPPLKIYLQAEGPDVNVRIGSLCSPESKRVSRQSKRTSSPELKQLLSNLLQEKSWRPPSGTL